MSSSLVGLLISVVVAVLLVGPLARPLRKHPVVFYVVALALTGLYVWAIWSGAKLASVRGLCMVMQKGYLSSILLGVVMFTGCFDDGTAVRKHLQPIRAKLSILSFIFIVGHLCMYLPSYLPRLSVLLASRTAVATSLVVSLVLTALFVVLTVTSFQWVHKAMNHRVWKNIQRLAYLMVGLFAVHVWFVLGASAFGGGVMLATVSFVAYTLVVLVYAVMRLAKFRRDQAAKSVGQETSAGAMA